MSANFDGGSDITPVDSLTGVSLDAPIGGYLSGNALGNQSSAWSGLDDLGSTVTNVGSGLLSSLGNLVSAQINQTALLTSTGRTAASLQAQKAQAKANQWRTYAMVAVVLVAVAVGLHAWKKR